MVHQTLLDIHVDHAAAPHHGHEGVLDNQGVGANRDRVHRGHGGTVQSDPVGSEVDLLGVHLGGSRRRRQNLVRCRQGTGQFGGHGEGSLHHHFTRQDAVVTHGHHLDLGVGIHRRPHQLLDLEITDGAPAHQHPPRQRLPPIRRGGDFFQKGSIKIADHHVPQLQGIPGADHRKILRARGTGTGGDRRLQTDLVFRHRPTQLHLTLGLHRQTAGAFGSGGSADITDPGGHHFNIGHGIDLEPITSVTDPVHPAGLKAEPSGSQRHSRHIRIREQLESVGQIPGEIIPNQTNGFHKIGKLGQVIKPTHLQRLGVIRSGGAVIRGKASPSSGRHPEVDPIGVEDRFGEDLFLDKDSGFGSRPHGDSGLIRRCGSEGSGRIKIEILNRHSQGDGVAPSASSHRPVRQAAGSVQPGKPLARPRLTFSGRRGGLKVKEGVQDLHEGLPLRTVVGNHRPGDQINPAGRRERANIHIRGRQRAEGGK